MRHRSRLVKWVMYQERCKADEAQGRGCCTWTIGTRMEEGESKERSVEDGLMYAKRDAAANDARCLLDPAENEVSPTATAKRAVIEEERWKVEEAARVAGIPVRIERGELVVAKYFQPVWGVWMTVDEKTEARHFRERNVGCEEYGGRMWVEKKQVWETGVWTLETSGGVGGLGVGWVWTQEANGAKSGSDIEMGNTGNVGVVSRRVSKKAKLAK